MTSLPPLAIPPPEQPDILGERLAQQPKTSLLAQQQQQEHEQQEQQQQEQQQQKGSFIGSHSPKGVNEDLQKRRSIPSSAISNIAANLDIQFGNSKGGPGGRIGRASPVMGGRPQIQIERKTSLDLEVMGEWLKGGERVRVYFGEGKREGEGEGEEGGKKKKKGEKKSKKDKASSVYGLSLQEMYAESGFPIPIVVAQCMSYLKQSNGLKLEGIFRISAPIREVDRLKYLYKDPTTVINLSEETDNPHVIACLLKQYFTMMPDPLIPFNETDALVKAYQNNEENVTDMVAALTEIIKRLPFLEASLLRFLIQFLGQMGVYAEGNFMTADNLAICFGPNLIRFKNASAAMMGSQIEAKVTAVLIKHYSEIFESIAEGDAPELCKEKEKEKKKRRVRPTSTIQPKLNAAVAEGGSKIKGKAVGKRVSRSRIRSQMVAGGGAGGLKGICPTCSKNVDPLMGRICQVCHLNWCCMECTRAAKEGECLHGGNHQFASPRGSLSNLGSSTSSLFASSLPNNSTFPPPSCGSPPSPTPSLSPVNTPASPPGMPRSPPLGGVGFKNELLGALKARNGE